jgi:hypothetical protein
MASRMDIARAFLAVGRSRAVLAVAAGLLLSGSAGAGTLSVPSAGFPTIQSAINAAVSGDTVVVAKGTYVESLDIKEKSGIVVRAAGKVVIPASDFNTGITIAMSTDIEVRGFTIEDAREHSIVVACNSNVLVSKCRILGGDGDGIRVFSGPGVRLEHNFIEGVALDGIRLLELQPDEPGGIPCGGPIDVLLLKNRVQQTGGDGISITGTGIVAEKNRVVDVAGDGMLALPDGPGAVLRKNRIVGAGGRGLVVQATGITLDHNRIQKPASSGVVLEPGAEGATLLGNRVVKAGTNGLVLDASGGSCTGARAIKSGTHGFMVGGNGIVLDQCRSSHAWFHGFNVYCSSSTFLHCRATTSGYLDLVDFAAGDTTNTYVGCTFKTTNMP